ncbi:MAG TPA: calcium/sodium antiporter [Woeseiaceae bacterium]
MIYLQLAGSLLLLLLGGETLVRGAVALATRLGVSPLLIGLTLVGFGTSTPELITSIEAAVVGSPGIAVGNVVGSNIANILLILGIAALIAPIAISRSAFFRDGSVAMLAAIACVGVCLSGSLQPMAGVFLLALLIGYIVYCFVAERVTATVADASIDPSLALPGSSGIRLPIALALFLSGLVLTMLAAHMLVGSAIAIGAAAGISETVLGVTVVAVGTSLPELVTSVLAAWRRQPDIAFGNIVGSNIYNVFGILGITAIVEPIPVPPELLDADIWVMLGATALLLVFSLTGWRLSRFEGGLFLAAYAAYLAFIVFG